MLRGKGIHYIDCGTSGGVFGLERGFCLMIGGEDDAVERLDPIFALARTRRRGRDRARRAGPATPAAGEEGWLHCGPAGAGHFVKMVHNGIEYGLMAAYAEGLNILRQRRRGHPGAHRRRRDRAAARPAVLPVRASTCPPSPRSGGAGRSSRRGCWT